MERLVPAGAMHENDGPLPISSRVQQMRILIAEATPFLRSRIEELCNMVREDTTIITQRSDSMLRVWSLDDDEDRFRDSSCPPFLCCCCCLWTWCLPRRCVRPIVVSWNQLYTSIDPSYLRLVYDSLSDADILKCLATQSQIIITSIGSPMVVLKTRRSILLAWKDRDLVAASERACPPHLIQNFQLKAIEKYPSIM